MNLWNQGCTSLVYLILSLCVYTIYIYYIYIYVHTEPVHAFLNFIVELGPLLSALGPLFSAVINPIRVEFVVRSEPPTRER